MPHAMKADAYNVRANFHAQFASPDRTLSAVQWRLAVEALSAVRGTT